ncbi:hypothetical protein [Roseobacter weihaiensis]|uniref:hypothetical protein n=1 Tax=Roseobacter weihaiensis TaxID=2763262 RepID=UPI001D0B267A|nr:hypothetical protein [Roseobacter sp. H9]
MRISLLAALCLTVSMPAFGDTAHAERVDHHLTQLQLHARSAFRLYDIDVDPRSLTLGQLAQIESVLDSEDSGGQKRARIRTIADQ